MFSKTKKKTYSVNELTTMSKTLKNYFTSTSFIHGLDQTLLLLNFQHDLALLIDRIKDAISRFPAKTMLEHYLTIMDKAIGKESSLWKEVG